MKKYLLGIFVVLFAVSLSAFTSPRSHKSLTSLVWFKVDKDGVIQNPTAGVLGETPPAGYNCPDEGFEYCAFGYAVAEATYNGSMLDTYTINPESETFNHHDDRNDEVYEVEED